MMSKNSLVPCCRLSPFAPVLIASDVRAYCRSVSSCAGSGIACRNVFGVYNVLILARAVPQWTGVVPSSRKVGWVIFTNCFKLRNFLYYLYIEYLAELFFLPHSPDGVTVDTVNNLVYIAESTNQIVKLVNRTSIPSCSDPTPTQHLHTFRPLGEPEGWQNKYCTFGTETKSNHPYRKT
jgi:hypothetical protein